MKIIAIKLLLVAIIVEAAFWGNMKSGIISCPTYLFVVGELNFIQETLYQFQQHQGYLPTSLSSLECAPNTPRKLHQDCVNFIPQDAWGHELIYIVPAKYGTLAFDLYSRGADGKDDQGTGDDISNWNGASDWYYEPDKLMSILKLLLVFGALYLLFFHTWRRK